MAKVLVIDDEPSIATLVAEVIEGYGHEVTIAYNGRQGLELARSGAFQLIISDIMMPYLNGRDLLKVIRSDPKLEHINFVLMSAVAQLANLDQEASADAFIVKPFDLTVVEKVVSNFLPAPPPERNFNAPYHLPYQASSKDRGDYYNYMEQ